MKRVFIFALLCALFTSCTKQTDNFYASTTPSYVISGIEDIKLQNGVVTKASLPLTVQYMDSTQQTVTLSITGMPPGITLDSTSVLSGTPTFNTTLTFYDTSTSIVPTAGVYPITIACYGTLAFQKEFTFNLTVVQ